MLSSDDVAVRLVGLAFVRELGKANEAYRQMSVKVLRAFVSDSKLGEGDAAVAQTTITYLAIVGYDGES